MDTYLNYSANRKRNLILGCVFSLSTVLAILVMAWTAMDLPIVQMSHETGQCVDVLPSGDCNELPKKYVIEWVK